MNTDQSNPLKSPFSSQAQPGRSRVKVAVFSVLAVHVAGLTALLLTQGCKRETQPEVEPQPEMPMLSSNDLFYTESNPPTDLPPADSAALPPPGTDPYMQPTTPALPPPSTLAQPPMATASEYVVKSGDSFYTIAKANNTTVKAIEAANPGVNPLKLQIGQKLVLPPPQTAAPATTTATVDPNVYVVKSGDTLSRIATEYKTTVKELKSLNGLVTDRINVGQKLKLPPPPAPAPAPVTSPLPEPTYPAPPTGQ